MSIDFTVAFICHSELELLEKTIKQNLAALRETAQGEEFDSIMVVDGAETAPTALLTEFAFREGINEVRLRTRKSLCATGDPSNNGHYYIIRHKSKYLITLEGDVVMFLNNSNFNLFQNIRDFFERHKDIFLATKIDDFECWSWKLKQVSENFEEGIQSVNRVSSHFLIYQLERFHNYFDRNSPISLNSFYDTQTSWFNYEDYLSKHVAVPNGPGIAFLESFPISVYHCDRKVADGSPFYSKNIEDKIKVFYQRREQTLKKKIKLEKN